MRVLLFLPNDLINNFKIIHQWVQTITFANLYV